MGLPVPKVFTDLGQAVLTKVADKFVDFIIIKYTGKSIKVFQAEGDIAADKIMTRWEVLEKPFWLQAEAKKMNRQYSNVEKIVLKATPHIIATENKITEDNDIFWGLLEHSKEISNDEMQTLIAKIIAGEYNSPETYSMSTLQVIKMLDKKTLNIFEDICCFLINGDHLPAFLFSSGHSLEKFMKEKNIDFGKLQLLQSLGLFFPNPMTWNAEKQNIEDYALSYFSEKILYSTIFLSVVSSGRTDIKAPFSKVY